ncbi:MAG: YhfC family intramembrane metalloprotease [Butyrivibrio sp.]|nr:YhfC family intramembrane metalloprotease [Butyrivibrio sp.]
MIGTSTFVYMGIIIAVGIIMPLAVAIWWVKTRNDKFSTVLVGAATWFLFAMVLETIPKAVLFNPATSIGKTVLGNTFLYVFFGTLLAGVFEEVGRYVAFKTVLKKRTNRETGISHGIGHGGFEAMFIMVSLGVQNLIYCFMINGGTFGVLVNQEGLSEADLATLNAIPEQLATWSLGYTVILIVERVYSMLLHAGSSVIVFNAVKQKRISLLFLAIILHMIFDTPAALYQKGVLNIYVTEVIGAVMAIVFFIIIYKKLYVRDTSQEKPRDMTEKL